MWYYGDYCMLYPSQYKYIILEKFKSFLLSSVRLSYIACTLNSVAKFLVPDWGEIVDSGI